MLSSRTIRLFVSSTFSDMKAERDILQDKVFPRLQQHCLANGLRLQAIDLRWGVPEEAGTHSHTATLRPGQSPCLNLPNSAFDDPRILTNCPRCAKPLKFNPFFVYRE